LRGGGCYQWPEASQHYTSGPEDSRRSLRQFHAEIASWPADRCPECCDFGARLGLQ
jgi:hypothetical protein